MYFIIDSLDQSVVAAKSMGNAARAVLDKLDITLPPQTDPVKLAVSSMGDRLAILNLSAALDSISESDDQAAQELAGSMRDAVDRLFNEAK